MATLPWTFNTSYYPEPLYYPNEGYRATREVLFEKYEPHKLNLFFTSVEVKVGTRKLRANWTPQLAEDVAAFQSIDAEAELTLLLNPNIENIQTRKVLIEKFKPDTFWVGTDTWTPEFTKDYYSLWAPPQ
jgi:hypothetical protein